MLRAAFTSALPAYPQAVHRNRAWLSRDLPSTCPHAEHRWLVYAAGTFCDPAGGLVLQPAHQQPPARPGDPPVQPGLGPDVAARPLRGPLRRPGHAPDVQVLDADHVEAAGDAGGRLLAPVPAPVPLAGLQPGDRRPGLAAPGRSAPARASPRWRRRSRARSRAPSPGTVSVSPVDSAALTVTPRSMPTAAPVPGPWTGAGMTANATCQRPARSRLTRNDRASAGTARDQRNRDPAGLRHPDLAPVPAHAAHVPRPAALPGDPEPLVPAGLAPRRAAVRPGEQARHGPREVPQRLLLHRLAAPGEPRAARPRGRQLPGLLQVAGRGTAPRAPPGVLLDREVPHVPGVRAVPQQDGFLLAGRLESVSGHANIIPDLNSLRGSTMARSLPRFAGHRPTPRPEGQGLRRRLR